MKSWSQSIETRVDTAHAVMSSQGTLQKAEKKGKTTQISVLQTCILFISVYATNSFSTVFKPKSFPTDQQSLSGVPIRKLKGKKATARVDEKLISECPTRPHHQLHVMELGQLGVLEIFS